MLKKMLLVILLLGASPLTVESDPVYDYCLERMSRAFARSEIIPERLKGASNNHVLGESLR